MSKAKKVLTTILVFLALLIGGAITVCFIVFPTQSQEYFNKFKELLSQPLPIVGVSLVVVFSGVLTIISRTTIGKKFLTELKKTNDELKADYETKIKEANDILNQTKEQLEKTKVTLNQTKEVIVEICQTSPNKKVQAIAEKVKEYEETING